MSDWPREYVRKVLADKNLTPTGLAEIIGVSSTTLTRPLNNPNHPHSISRRTLDLIRQRTGIPFDGPQDSEMSDDTLIAVYDVAASAGYGAIVDREDVIDRLAFPQDYLGRITSTKPRHLAIISVKGDSMLPTLRDDDVVMIDTTKTSPAFDGLAVLEMDGALHVKRLARGTKPGLVAVLSDNPSYPDREYPSADMRIVGKVLWSGRKE